MSELTKALIGFHKAVDKIEKNARANYGKFADLANVLSTVTPALHANGLAITQTFLDDSLVTTLHHESGETLSSSCKLIMCDGRNVTQEWGKAVTYQRRFSICSILGIVADMDTDDVPDLPPSTKTFSEFLPQPNPNQKRLILHQTPSSVGVCVDKGQLFTELNLLVFHQKHQ